MEKGATALEELPGKLQKRSRLAEGVTHHHLKSLRLLVNPLGKGDALPPRKYLDRWWEQVYNCLRSIDQTVVIEQLPRGVIDALGAVLLGSAAWDLIGYQDFHCWQGFVKCVESRFGVDSSYKENLFLHLKRAEGEDGLDFIQRVEDMRIKLAYDDKTALIKTWGDLPGDIKAELERIHDTLDKGKI